MQKRGEGEPTTAGQSPLINGIEVTIFTSTLFEKTPQLPHEQITLTEDIGYWFTK
jgi:hypothetical protein